MELVEAPHSFTPGDNRVDVDCIVNMVPFIRGVRAALHFADKKDDSNTFNGVRLTPFADRMVISAANPLSMFATSAQFHTDPGVDCGVVDVPLWMAKHVVSLYGSSSDPEAILWIRARKSTVCFRDQTGLFPGDIHQWDRHEFSESAPDVPAALTRIFEQPRWEPDFLVTTDNETHRVCQVQKIFSSPAVVDCTRTHARYRVGTSAKIAVILPEEMRQESLDLDEEPSDNDDQDDEESSQPEDRAQRVRVVRAQPRGGAV